MLVEQTIFNVFQDLIRFVVGAYRDFLHKALGVAEDYSAEILGIIRLRGESRRRPKRTQDRVLLVRGRRLVIKLQQAIDRRPTYGF